MTEVPARLYEDLTRDDARALVDTYTAGIGSRADGAIAEVRKRSGPANELDFSRDSLVPLWTWFIGAFQLPAERGRDEEMRAGEPPWWYDFHPPMGQQLGPEIARVITNIAGYVVKTALATLPGTEVVLGGGGKRSNEFQKPLLRVPRYGDIAVDIGLVIMTIRGLRHEFGMDAPETLKAMIESWDIPPTRDDSSQLVESTFDVTAIEDHRFTHRVSIDEVVAVDEEARVEALVQRLSELDTLDEVVHEDRELLLVRAPRMASDELEQLVEKAWASTHA